MSLESMTMPRNLTAALCAALTLLSAGTVATPAFADALPSEAAISRVISVPRDKSLSFRLDEPATKIVVSQPDIAEVVATTDRSFYVRGIDIGSTNLLVCWPRRPPDGSDRHAGRRRRLCPFFRARSGLCCPMSTSRSRTSAKASC